MRLAACVALLLSFPGNASAQPILGAGREWVALSWEPASGPVAYYEVACTVDGVPDVLIGTTSEPRLEIEPVPSLLGQEFGACVVRAFDGDGNPGPPSDPSDASFQFLADADLDGDGVVGTSDLSWLQALQPSGPEDLRTLLTIARTFGCSVDLASRIYVDCPPAGW